MILNLTIWILLGDALGIIARDVLIDALHLEQNTHHDHARVPNTVVVGVADETG